MIQNSTSGYLFWGNETTLLQRYMHLHAHCSIIYNRQDVETACVSANEWMKKENLGMNKDNPGKPKNSLSLLQGIFPIQESNRDLLRLYIQWNIIQL